MVPLGPSRDRPVSRDEHGAGVPRRLRFAVAVHGPEVAPWDAACIRRMAGLEHAELAMCVLPAPGVEASSQRPLPLRHALWAWIERRVRARMVNSYHPVDLDSVIGGVTRRQVTPVRRSDGTVELSPADVAALSAEGVEVLVDLVFGGLRGGVVGTCPKGVWTFVFGEARTGRPLGFEEILHGNLVRAALVRVANDPAHDRVLHQGCFRTVKDSLVQTRAAVLSGVASWPAREMRRSLAHTNGSGSLPLRNGRPEEPRVAPRQGTSRRAPRTPGADPPGTLEVLGFLRRLGRNYVAGVWRELFRHELWALGVVRRPVHELLDARRLHVEWLPTRRPKGYLADPFGIVVGDGLHVLAEEYDYPSNRGRITAISFRGDRTVARWVPEAIRLPSHASYPFLLQHEGEVYCIPETSAEREVRLYRARRFPDDWEQVGVLVSGFAAADSTLFQHNGLWWLFCVEAGGDARTHLHGWWSPTLGGRWRPHLLNPLKSDVRSSRPAGPVFRRDGRLYRPAQDCSHTYGEAVALNRIDELTPTTFREEWVHTLRPDPTSAFPHGLHTLTGVGDVTLVDGKRWVLVPSELRRATLARLARAFGRPATTG